MANIRYNEVISVISLDNVTTCAEASNGVACSARDTYHWMMLIPSLPCGRYFYCQPYIHCTKSKTSKKSSLKYPIRNNNNNSSSFKNNNKQRAYRKPRGVANLNLFHFKIVITIVKWQIIDFFFFFFVLFWRHFKFIKISDISPWQQGIRFKRLKSFFYVFLASLLIQICL